MSTELKDKEHPKPIKSIKEYFSQLYIIFCLISMVWVLANDDHNLIRYWYSFLLSSLLLFRTISFFKRGFQWYLIEMCYIINVLSIAIILFNYDIKTIYPFIHGPLMAYSLAFGDSIIFHDLAKTTTYAIHSAGSVVTRRLYWNGMAQTYALGDLTPSVFGMHFVNCMKIYFMWALPYYIWLALYDGNLMTMAKYTFRMNSDDKLTVYLKLKYAFLHFVAISIALMVGIFSMYCWQFNYFVIGCQIFSGFAHGASYDFTGHKINFFKLFANAYLKVYSKVKHEIKEFGIKLSKKTN